MLFGNHFTKITLISLFTTNDLLPFVRYEVFSNICKLSSVSFLKLHKIAYFFFSFVDLELSVDDANVLIRTRRRLIRIQAVCIMALRSRLAGKRVNPFTTIGDYSRQRKQCSPSLDATFQRRRLSWDCTIFRYIQPILIG